MAQRNLVDEIRSLQSKVDAFRQSSSTTKQERYEARSALVNLANSIEPPIERALRTLFESWPPMAALAVAIRAGWFYSMVQHGTQTAQQLGEAHGADAVVIGTRDHDQYSCCVC